MPRSAPSSFLSTARKRAFSSSSSRSELRGPHNLGEGDIALRARVGGVRVSSVELGAGERAMGEKEAKKVETSVEAGKELPEKKAVAQPPPEEKLDESKALVVVEKVAVSSPPEKSSASSADRDAVLARVATEKRISLIKAWEESEKTKAENKAQKKMSSIASWENTKKAAVEAELKKIEEALEMKKAEYAEKMKNKIAMIHKAAAEKRAIVEAKRGEEMLKAEETAAKYHATGLYPKKVLGCFSA